MVVVLILVLLALVLGVGAVLEGIAWALLITLALLVAAGWYGWTKVRGVGQSR
jgi:hypothetical protein